jgi:hypothetical protein
VTKNFGKKTPQLKIFKNTLRPAEIPTYSQIWGALTLGPRKSSETYVLVFIALLRFFKVTLS